MLRKKSRLGGGKIKSERTISSPIYTLKIAKNKKLLSRFGFVVSKKIDKRAVVRNRIKRKFRNCIEQNLEKIAKGYDFLFILKKNIEGINYCDILLSQLKKEKLMQ